MNAYTSFHCTCLVTIEQGLSRCSALIIPGVSLLEDGITMAPLRGTNLPGIVAIVRFI